MAKKQKYDFNIPLLIQGDNNAWKQYYTKLNTILKSRAFTTGKQFDEDVFAETMIIMHSKMDQITTNSALVNLTFAVYRNQSLNFNTERAKYSGRAYIQTEEGYAELTPDHLGCSQTDVDAQIDIEQLEYDLSALKQRFRDIQDSLNKNNKAKYINLEQLMFDYATDHTISNTEIMKKYDLNSLQSLRNVVSLIENEFGFKIKKANKPYDELSATGKSQKRRAIKQRLIYG